MRGVRRRGKSAGADEERSHEVGGDDCPICQLPLPPDLLNQSMYNPCCMKRVCNGCVLASRKRGMEDCPFCRTPIADESQALAMIQARVAAGDPMAICNLGTKYHFGRYGLEKDVTRAVELYERAADLGVKEAHYNLACLYAKGTDVEEDTFKAFHHFEAAAMCGHVPARKNLGTMEYNAGNYDLALQHYLISAKLGYDRSVTNVRRMFMDGLATKADYAAALRGHQSAIEEMSSPDRDEAKVLGRDMINQIQQSGRPLGGGMLGLRSVQRRLQGREWSRLDPELAEQMRELDGPALRGLLSGDVKPRSAQRRREERPGPWGRSVGGGSYSVTGRHPTIGGGVPRRRGRGRRPVREGRAGAGEASVMTNESTPSERGQAASTGERTDAGAVPAGERPYEHRDGASGGPSPPWVNNPPGVEPTGS
ncbi:hypothetical protein THAOC_33641, partial [Thalassiosira oceanica]